MSIWIYQIPLMAILAVSGCSPPEPAAPKIQGSSKALTEALPVNMAEVTIKVDGMACQGCADSIAEIVSKMAGVEAARGDFKKGVLVARYHPKAVTPAAIIQAIIAIDRDEESGFKATLTGY